MSKRPILSLVAIIITVSCLFAHDTGAGEDVGIDEHLGAYVPLDLIFRDETGAYVSLEELIDTPTFLVITYYHCENACSVLLSSMAAAVSLLKAVPGEEYRVISVSIDSSEGTEEAAAAKRITMAEIGGVLPPDSWRFLTGEDININELTQTVGYQWRRVGDDFDHPLAIVVVSVSGKITRYIYGETFLPADLKISIMEASEGRIGPTISKVLRFCFRVDRKNNILVFNTLKVTAVVTLSFAAGFILFLVLYKRKRNPQREGTDNE